MKKYCLIIGLTILLFPGLATPDIFSLKAGYFIPRAQSDLWDIEFENMNFSKSNFQTTNFCFAYEYFLTREFSLVLSIDTYSKNKAGLYLEYVDDPYDDFYYAFESALYDGNPIGHSFSVSITPIQFSAKLTPLGRRGRLIPYIGGGVGLYLWYVKIIGELVDFSAGEWFYDPYFDDYVIGYPIDIVNAIEENKLKVGYHVFGGFMVPVAHRLSLEAEVKYNAVKGDLTDYFEGFEPFDLGGYQITIGLNYWF